MNEAHGLRSLWRGARGRRWNGRKIDGQWSGIFIASALLAPVGRRFRHRSFVTSNPITTSQFQNLELTNE
jgi:hypothetical protein